MKEEKENLSRCSGCNKKVPSYELEIEKIKRTYGYYCKRCIGAWEDYVDRKIMERRGK